MSRLLTIRVLVEVILVALALIGANNTWERISLQSKVRYLAEHRLPASLALSDDWVTAPSLVVWNGLEASK